jgi:hypothetical protein
MIAERVVKVSHHPNDVIGYGVGRQISLELPDKSQIRAICRGGLIAQGVAILGLSDGPSGNPYIQSFPIGTQLVVDTQTENREVKSFLPRDVLNYRIGSQVSIEGPIGDKLQVHLRGGKIGENGSFVLALSDSVRLISNLFHHLPS